MIARGAAGVVTREPNGNSFATLEREPSVYRYRSERDYHDLYRERGLVGVASSSNRRSLCATGGVVEAGGGRPRTG